MGRYRDHAETAYNHHENLNAPLLVKEIAQIQNLETQNPKWRIEDEHSF